MPWGGYKKICCDNCRVTNICRPDDPDAWVLRGPKAPGEDAIFQHVKGIFSYFFVAFGHICPHVVRWLQQNLLWQLGLTTFADLMIQMYECYLDQGLLLRMPTFSMSRGYFIFLFLPLATFGYMLWDGYKKICRPDDPDAWVLPGPGAPGEDAIFQYVKGILYIFIVACGHISPHAVRWLQKNCCDS